MLQPGTTPDLLSGFSLADIQYLADNNPSLRGYLQGYLAELKLKSLLESFPGVGSIEKIPDCSSDKGDFRVGYKGSTIVVESKSFRSYSRRTNTLTESWEASVDCKNPGSRVLEVEGRGQVRSSCIEERRFDVLAVCTWPVTGTWTFLFAPEAFLPRALDMPGFLQSRLRVDPVTTPGFFWDPEAAFDLALSLKSSAKIRY